MKPDTTGRAILDPTDRLAEVMFGLLMVLSFTGTMSVAVAEGDQVRAVLMAALACNVAWGIVDAVMWVVLTGVDRAREETRRNALRAGTTADARTVLADRLPSLDAALSDAEIGGLLDRVRASPPVDPAPFVTGREFAGAGVIFLLVAGATLPPSIPFLLTSDIDLAMRTSNVIALVLLFVIGARLGRVMGRSPWPMAFAMSGIGTSLVLVTIALGG